MKEIKREEIMNMSYKDITYLILEKEKKGINTLELFTKIISILELPSSIIENKIGDYYTSLTTDKRFILIDGLWDLRTRHTSDKIIIDSIEEDDIELDSLDEEDINTENEYEEDEDDYTSNSLAKDDYDDNDDDLADLVILDEDELTE